MTVWNSVIGFGDDTFGGGETTEALLVMFSHPPPPTVFVGYQCGGHLRCSVDGGSSYPSMIFPGVVCCHHEPKA